MPRPSFEEIQDFYRNGHKAPRRRRIWAVVAFVLRRLPPHGAGTSVKAAGTARIAEQA